MTNNTARDRFCARSRDPRRVARFRAAYENRYTWDSDFPGYTTKLELKQGDEIIQPILK